MFLPIGDIPNPRTTPYVNWALISINIAVFLLIALPQMMARPDLNDPALIDYLQMLGAKGALPVQAIYEHISAYDLLVFKYGYRPADPSLLTMFTAMFLHGGWMHLAGNMLFLWIYGDNVEHRLGHVGYLLAYLGTGVAATLFFGLFVPGSQVPMLGASGAISGVLGFYFLWFPRNQIKVFIFLFPLIMTTVLIPARIVLGIYLILDNLLPFMMNTGAGSGVAHGAHIGGFVAGLGVAYGVDRLPGLLHLRATTPRVSKQWSRQGNAVTDIVQSIDRGDLAQASRRYLELENSSQRGQLATSKVLAIGDFLLESGKPDLALTVYRRLVAERPGEVNLDRAYLGAGKAMLHKARGETSAYHYFLAAIDLAQTPGVVQEARRYLRMIEDKG
jgi:membrane associated rhomboid family serine protease